MNAPTYIQRTSWSRRSTRSLLTLLFAGGFAVALAGATVVGVFLEQTPAHAQSTIPPTGDTAQGSGATYLGGDTLAHFDFSATSGSSGESPTGDMTYSDKFGELQASVDCLAVSGNKAIVTGIITQATPLSSIVVGSRVKFWVVDNGTPGAGQDRFLQNNSDLYDRDISGANCGESSPDETSTRFDSALPLLTGEIAIVDQADTTPPTLWLPAPADVTQMVSAGQESAQVRFTVTATDNMDPAPVVTCSPISGSTFQLGNTTVSCTATDKSGNTATATFKVSVVYDFGGDGTTGDGGGFLAPLEDDAVNQVKSGATVPVKFSLGGYYGDESQIFYAGYPRSRGIDSVSGEVNPVDEVATDSTPAGLRYDESTGQYIYNWKTDRAWFGTYRQLVFKFKDETEHVVTFEFR